MKTLLEVILFTYIAVAVLWMVLSGMSKLFKKGSQLIEIVVDLLFIAVFVISLICSISVICYVEHPEIFNNLLLK